MNLLIVESPGKIEKLKHILGDGWDVKASYGHIRDLPKNDMGVEAPDFEPHYEATERGAKTIALLKEAVAKADEVYLATLMSNTPNYQGMFLRGAGSQWKNYNGYGWTEHGTTLGQVQGDGIRNITGSNNSPVFFPFANGHSQGAFTEYHNGTGWVVRYALGDTGINSGIQFNASLTVPTANENRPVNVGVKYIIKAE